LLAAQSLPRAWLSNWRRRSELSVMNDDVAQKEWLNASDVDRRSLNIAQFLRRNGEWSCLRPIFPTRFAQD
jgi:hypothetical protein